MADQERAPVEGTGTPESVSTFLVELARALQRFGMYPQGHPARLKTIATVCESFGALSAQRKELSIEVQPDHLVVDGTATDPSQKVLTGMADRLYQHQLLSLTFRIGLEESELADLLGEVSAAVGATGQPLGAAGESLRERWPHVTVEPIPFESLAFKAEEGAVQHAPSAATAIPEVDEGGADTAAGGPKEELAAPGPAADPEPEGDSLQKKIARLILKLDTDSLRSLVRKMSAETGAQSGSDDQMRTAVNELLQAAESGRLAEPSEALLKLITKMGIHSDDAGGGEKGGDDEPSSIADMLKELSGDWDLDDPSPQDYRDALKGLSREAAVLGRTPVWIEKPEPERVVQMALELDEIGPQVERSITEMLAGGRVAALLSLMESAPDDLENGERFWELVARIEVVVQLLRAEPPDLALADRLIPRLKVADAGPLLDLLGDIESASRAGEIADRLARLGPEVRQGALERLEDERWHVRRNMLALLDRFDDLPEEFVIGPYLVDPDPRVRREAMRLGLLAWEEVETVMVAALEDSDPQIVELGLAAARKECPPLVVPYLESLATDTSAASSIRVGAIQALAASGAESALPTLLHIAWTPRFFWVRGLAEKSSEMLAALAALQSGWSDDPGAAKVLKAAGRSKDAQVRAVVRGRGRSG